MHTKLKHIQGLTYSQICKTGNHDHFCDEKSFNFLFKEIITNEHQMLKKQLDQIIEDLDLNNKRIWEYFFQIHVTTNSKEVIFCLIKNETIYPLIFDLNHCICKVAPNKGIPLYCFNKKTQKEWSHQKNQQNLKIKLIS